MINSKKSFHEKNYHFIIQAVLIALLFLYSIIQKMEADKQRERADWIQRESEEVQIKNEKLRHELDSLKKLQSNSDK